jgi:NAD-dependent SIR2 family protein deacetylase
VTVAKKKSAVARAAALIADADALVIAAGAGMGVDSGLPDFRGNDGFWKAYPALARDRVDFASIASPYAFRETPDEAWGFYGHRLALYRATQPHAGFALLRAWGERMPGGYRVFTSNVDGAFQKAGVPDELVTECHGSIHHLQCLAPCRDAIWPADAFVPDVDHATCHLRNDAPRCPFCGGLARPQIMMFGDSGWVSGGRGRREQRLTKWLRGVRRPVVVEIGAGTAIPSVRRFSSDVRDYHGGRVIRINPREHAVDDRRDVGLALGGLEGLLAIGESLEGVAA